MSEEEEIKTTISVKKEIWTLVKIYATLKGKKLYEVVNEALERFLKEELTPELLAKELKQGVTARREE